MTILLYSGNLTPQDGLNLFATTLIRSRQRTNKSRINRKTRELALAIPTNIIKREATNCLFKPVPDLSIGSPCVAAEVVVEGLTSQG